MPSKMLTGAIRKVRPSTFKRVKRGLQIHLGLGRYNVFKRFEKTRSRYATNAARNVFVRGRAGAKTRMDRLNRRMTQAVGVGRKKAIRHVLQRATLPAAGVYGGLGVTGTYLQRKQKRKMAAARARRKG